MDNLYKIGDKIAEASAVKENGGTDAAPSAPAAPVDAAPAAMFRIICTAIRTAKIFLFGRAIVSIPFQLIQSGSNTGGRAVMTLRR